MSYRGPLLEEVPIDEAPIAIIPVPSMIWSMSWFFVISSIRRVNPSCHISKTMVESLISRLYRWMASSGPSNPYRPEIRDLMSAVFPGRGWDLAVQAPDVPGCGQEEDTLLPFLETPASGGEMSYMEDLQVLSLPGHSSLPDMIEDGVSASQEEFSSRGRQGRSDGVGCQCTRLSTSGFAIGARNNIKEPGFPSTHARSSMPPVLPHSCGLRQASSADPRLRRAALGLRRGLGPCL